MHGMQQQSNYVPGQRAVFDGKRMRKAITRRTVEYNATIVRMLENHSSPTLSIQPHPSYILNYLPPIASAVKGTGFIDDCLTMKHVHTSLNKQRCPINMVRWMPEGRRLVTGAATGEFTLWNGTTFNFETILQAHDTAIRAMCWTHSGALLLSGDHGGTIKYWQPSMNNVKNIAGAHAEPIRNICFSPGDSRFASCGDDGAIKIWNLERAEAERTLSGHGWDVKALAWHPHAALVASGSKDNLIKLWDPRTGDNVCTVHGHKNSILDVRFNRNGHWLLSSGKDQLIKLFDVRNPKTELTTFRGPHKKEINTLAWHPIHESFFASGSGDGVIAFWHYGGASPQEEPRGVLEGAHDNIIWSLDWHPLGHVLASGSADFSTRFWTRMRPADSGIDRYVIGKAQAEALGIKEQVPVMPESDDEPDMLPGLRQSNYRH